MAITAGQDAVAADFVSTSAGAGDSGKVPKLNSAGQLDNSFLDIGYVTLEAGEDIAAGDAVCIGDLTKGAILAYDISTNNTETSDYRGTNYKAQTFVATGYGITSVRIRFQIDGTPANTTVNLYATSGGYPTGSPLGTSDVVAVSTGEHTFTFSTPAPTTPGQTYALRVSASSGSADCHVSIATGDLYASGKAVSWNGSSWVDETSGWDWYMEINEADTETGKIYKTDASFATARADGFIGFAVAAITDGNSGVVKVTGPVTLSGLTAGKTYYLSNTAGAIATSAGTVSRMIGKALSATQFLIKHDNVA